VALEYIISLKIELHFGIIATFTYQNPLTVSILFIEIVAYLLVLHYLNANRALRKHLPGLGTSTFPRIWPWSVDEKPFIYIVGAYTVDC
jgi:hypothetical protein